MARVRTSVFISHSKIAALNERTGMIGRWTERFLGDAEDASRRMLAVKPPTKSGMRWQSTGDLSRSITSDVWGSNQFGVNAALNAGNARTDYAEYVHEGTYGPIMAGGKKMPVGIGLVSNGAIRADGPGYWKRSVSGQDGYPFLVLGMNIALVRHGLRPMGG